MKYFLIILFCGIYFISSSQEYNQIRILDSTSLSIKQNDFKRLYGFNKEIPQEYELSILLALSYLTELDSVRIILKKSRIKTTINVRPAFPSIFYNNRAMRKYIIRINTSKKDSIILLKDTPFNAKVGLFGHELNHIVDYESRNLFGILQRLFSYTNKKGKEKYEKEIDLMTINRNLGWQLYDWSFYILNESNATAKYKKFKREIYLEPSEILELIERRNSNFFK